MGGVQICPNGHTTKHTTCPQRKGVCYSCDAKFSVKRKGKKHKIRCRECDWATEWQVCWDCYQNLNITFHRVGREYVSEGKERKFNCAMCHEKIAVAHPQQVCKCVNCNYMICPSCLDA